MRPALVAPLVLLAVGLAALATAALSQRSHARLLVQRAEAGASDLRARHRAELIGALGVLQLACDQGVPPPALARALDADAWLLHERDRRLARTAASDDFGAALPSLAALERARGGFVTFVGRVPLVLVAASCARPEGRAWLVRVEPRSSLEARLAPLPPLTAISEAEAARALRDEHADARALVLDGVDGAPPLSLWLRAADPPPLDLLLTLLPLALLALIMAALLAYLLARRGVDESVLLELERAAERVAGGDLGARIALRPGGRADQTFRTFDRMTAELAEMRSRLAEAERAAAWQDMARRIAHEIKNPLQPIQLAIETLRKAQQKRLASFDEIFEESTRAILEEVRRMQHIVREFSEFARLPRARPGSLALAALIDETVALYRPDDVDVQVVHEHDGLQVRADREQLTQVIVNLLQNAIDAARASASPRVALRTGRRDHGAFVQVDDSGHGVAPQDREAVFQPYFTTKPEGTGLGLAIVRRIVLDHGGSVHVSEGALRGARLTVELPLPD